MPAASAPPADSVPVTLGEAREVTLGEVEAAIAQVGECDEFLDAYGRCTLPARG
jgi:hypothetical protein